MFTNSIYFGEHNYQIMPLKDTGDNKKIVSLAINSQAREISSSQYAKMPLEQFLYH